MFTNSKCKRDKNKISKLIEKSDSDDDKEYELSFYINDRVKLMKEVLKIIKSKKIKSMAPDCIKDLDIEEINSMLLEELLGISNKRLKYIFSGQNPGEDSSSTDPEEEKQPIDVISLDDISDEDLSDMDLERSKKLKNKNNESNTKIIKKEKHDRSKQKYIKEPLQEENLMSVLELLELQARARAIRSQLMLETNKQTSQQPNEVTDDSDTDDAVIIEQPKNDEIVITSSDSEYEQNLNYDAQKDNAVMEKSEDTEKKQKIKLIRNRFDTVQTKKENEKSKTKEDTNNYTIIVNTNVESNIQTEPTQIDSTNQHGSHSTQNPNENRRQNTFDNTEQEVKNNAQRTTDDDNEIILIVDQDEIDGIMCE